MTSLQDILDWDNWVCGPCGVPIPKAVPTNHVLAGTVDHIVPRREGGSEEPNNLQATHRRCNSAKSGAPDYDPFLPGSRNVRDLSYWFLQRGEDIEIYVSGQRIGAEDRLRSSGLGLQPGEWIHVAGT
jgi:hypothetical protein